MRRQSDDDILKACLRAAVEGPFFPDWEFSLLFGLERAEVAAILKTWPSSADSEKGRLAANNAMNNLLGYPHGVSPEVWSTFIPVTREALRVFFKRWRRSAYGDASAD